MSSRLDDTMARLDATMSRMDALEARQDAEDGGPWYVCNKSGRKVTGAISTFREAVQKAKSLGNGHYVENDEGELDWQPR